jgi:simple sugar transport system permease protein
VTKPAARGARSVPHEVLVVAWSIGGAIFVFNVVAFLFGEAPLATLARALEGTWGTPYGIGQVLFKATPLILTGLAFDLALRAGLFNIGAEGQLAMASLFGALVAAKLPSWMPWPIAAPIVIAAAMAMGALVALPAGVLRAYRGVHEIISTIMLNRIVDVLIPWTLATALGASSLRTDDIARNAAIPRLERFVPELHGSAASLAFFAATALAFGQARWLQRSRTGREIRWIGQGEAACRAEGIDVRSRILQAMLLSGALAGAVIAPTVLGYKGYFELGLGAGAGFSGIAVAMLGQGRPLGIVLAALLFGTLAQAGLAINARVPKEATALLEAIVILLVALPRRSSARSPAPAPEPAAPPEPKEAA